METRLNNDEVKEIARMQELIDYYELTLRSLFLITKLLGHVASNRIPVVCLTLDGSLVKTYPSMKHAELEGYSHSAIYQVAHNKRRTHGGYKWMYLSDYEKSLVNQ